MDDVDLRVLRLIGRHVVKDGAKILPLLSLSELRFKLPGADLKCGKQI